MGRQPVVLALVVFFARQKVAIGVEGLAREHADLAVEAFMRQLQFELDPGFLDDLVPAADTARRIAGIIIAQAHVDRGQRRHFVAHQLAVDEIPHRVGVVLQLVVVFQPVLHVAALDARVERVGGIGRDFLTEQVERQRVMQVQLLLDRRQVDDAQIADLVDVIGVGDAVGVHHLAGPLDRAAHAGFAHEHVVRFLGQHEAAGARQRVEARLCERFQLHLAVTVGEIGEHEEGQPVGRFLVEGAQHARRLFRPRGTDQQVIGLFAAVLAEVFLQQVHHRPQVTALFDVDLEQVAHVVERGRGQAEEALLLDRARLGIALDHDQALEHVAVFARNFLPRGLAHMLAAGNDTALDLGCQQNAPAVFRHLDVVELGPAFGVNRNGGAQVDHALLEVLRDQVVPPVDVTGMPFLQRLQHALVRRQAHIVGDLGVVADIDEVDHGFSSRGWCVQSRTLQCCPFALTL
eukprot:m.486 g.486  ORF g.486 m.486 type:complete len:462 (-) comp217_c1_seq1:31-1416(-)